MKVYRIEELGEVTHIAFDGSKKEAKNWYILETECDEKDISDFTLFPRKKWKEVTITFDEDDLQLTIEEYMQGHTWNEVLCSTAYL